MFNYDQKSPAEESERRQRRVRLISFGAVTAVIIGLIVALVSGSQQTADSDIQGILRSGDNQFDAYREKVRIELIETIVHPNLIGMAQHEVRARLSNEGDRPLTAVEIKGRMIGLDDAIITSSTAYPVPRSTRPPLPAGNSVSFSIKIDRPGNVSEDLVKDHLIELTGLRF
ncbi:MAG: hypothetical protein ACOYLF_06290 [Blastocatellia bacterium]|jgi:hypothetical protein